MLQLVVLQVAIEVNDNEETLVCFSTTNAHKALTEAVTFDVHTHRI